MTPSRPIAPVERLALNTDEAARCLGVSHETFLRHVRPNVRAVRIGTRVVFGVDELRRFLVEQAESRPARSSQQPPLTRTALNKGSVGA